MIFGLKKKAEGNSKAPAKKKTAKAAPQKKKTVGVHAYDVLVKPRITEKAARVNENNVFVFTVTSKADKATIAEAIKMLYKVTPVAIRTARTAPKPKTLRTRNGVGYTSGTKKAYVTLKKGDTIAF